MALEKQHVLTKKERAVMRAVYQAADKKSGVCLLTPIDLFNDLSLDLDFDEEELDATLRNLEIDDYFDVTRIRKGWLSRAWKKRSRATSNSKSFLPSSAAPAPERRRGA